MGENLPIVLIEVVLIFGGVLAFAWWQLHEIKVDQRKAAAERAAQAEREGHEAREVREVREALETPTADRPAPDAARPAHAPPSADAA
jgi:predicted negative regulator of RcsB-dependent stress response